MFQEHIKQLAKELDIPYHNETEYAYTLVLSPTLSIDIQEHTSTMHMRAQVGRLPIREREALFTYLLKANFLGQGTGGAILSIDPTETFFLCSHTKELSSSYEECKQMIEDFANYVSYWQTEVGRLNKSPSHPWTTK